MATIVLSLLAFPARAQIAAVRISEILADPAGPNNTQAIELFNAGPVPVSLNGAVIASNDQTRALSGLADVSPGGTVVIRWNQNGTSSGNQFFTGATFELNPAQGNVALFKSGQVTSASEMIAFVQWGAANQTRANLAAQAALWEATAFLPRAAEGQSMALLPGGLGRATGEWAALAPTIGAPNTSATATFGGWALVGGQSIQAPAAVTPAPAGGSALELLSVAPGGTVQHHRFLNGAWNRLPGPAGVLGQAPALVASGSETWELVGIGTDGQAHHSRFLGGQWTAFAPIGGQTALPAALTFNPTASTTELVIVGTDGELLHSRFDGEQWSSLAPIGDQSGASPALVFNPQEGTLELLFSALNRAVCQTSFTGSDWIPPSSTDGESVRTPAVAARPDGTVDTAITGLDGAVLQNRFQNGAWRGWKPIVGLQSDLPPTLVFNPESSTTVLFAVGRDGLVRYALRSGEVWKEASAIGAVAQFPPAAVPGTGGLVEVMITGRDGNLWHNRIQAKPAQTTPGISFAKEIQPIFTANCARSGCHAGNRAAEGMDLSAGESFANIVDVPSDQAGGLDRIEPGDPDNSYLLHKVQGTQSSVGGRGSRMPMGGRLSDAQIAKIRQWIEEGASDN